MTLTLSALVLLLLALPGVVTVYAYNGQILIPPSAVGNPRWHASLLWAVISTVLLHLFFIWILTETPLPNPDFLVALQLISGYTGSDSSYSVALQNVADNARVIFSYFIAIYIMAWYVGVYGRKFVVQFGLDLEFPLLRISNEWHYLFRGADQPVLPDVTIVSATVELCETPYLYIGLLWDYQFDSNGLRYVTLIGAKRRRLENDKRADDEEEATGKSVLTSKRFYPLEGEYLVVYCETVKTLNIDYIYAEDLEGPNDDLEAATSAA